MKDDTSLDQNDGAVLASILAVMAVLYLFSRMTVLGVALIGGDILDILAGVYVVGYLAYFCVRSI